MRPGRRKRDANDVVKGRGARSMKSEHLLSRAAGRAREMFSMTMVRSAAVRGCIHPKICILILSYF